MIGSQGGYVLLPVVLAITLIAAISFLLNREAGMNLELSARESEGDLAGYVAEAGLQHALWQIQKSDCTGYGLSDTSFGSHSYIAAVFPESGSPVTVSAVGTLAGGASRTLVREDIKVYEPPSLHSLQPGAEGKDSYVTNKSNDNNNGSQPYLNIQKGAGAGGAEHILVEFDLSALPSGARIISAELGLYATTVTAAAGGARLSVHRLLEPWTEEGVNFQTSDGSSSWAWPSNYDPSPIATETLHQDGVGWVGLDVTALARRWHRGSYLNNGMVLVGSPELWWAGFKSGEAPESALRPRLTLSYACECGVDCEEETPPACGDFTPDTKVGEFSAASYGAAKINGLTYLPEGTTFLGVSAQAGGGWICADWTKELYMTDMAGGLRASCMMDEFGAASTSGVTLVRSGTWANHLAVTVMQTNDLVAFVDLDCNPAATFPTLPFGSYTPSGIGFIGATESGMYEEHLAVADYFNDAVYIVDQGGALKATLDLSAFAGKVHGVSHLPETDRLLLADEERGRAYIVDFVAFGGAPLADFDAAPFGTAAPTAAAVNGSTCDQALGDETADKVVYLNAGGGPPAPALTLNPAADTWINQASGDSNYGGAAEFDVGVDAGMKRYRALVRFDLSAMPAGATVTSATLRLYVASELGTGSRPVGAYSLTAAWDEGTVTWNGSGGGAFDQGQPLDVQSVPWQVGWSEWSIPAGLIHEWIDGVTANNGLLLDYRDVKKNQRLHLSSREGSRPPELVIEYSEP